MLWVWFFCASIIVIIFNNVFTNINHHMKKNLLLVFAFAATFTL